MRSGAREVSTYTFNYFCILKFLSSNIDFFHNFNMSIKDIKSLEKREDKCNRMG